LIWKRLRRNDIGKFVKVTTESKHSQSGGGLFLKVVDRLAGIVDLGRSRMVRAQSKQSSTVVFGMESKITILLPPSHRGIVS
jgi:hypothetical protein